jgi:hypothetical protein
MCKNDKVSVYYLTIPDSCKKYPVNIASMIQSLYQCLLSFNRKCGDKEKKDEILM